MAWTSSVDSAVLVGRVVNALRQLAEIDWKAFFQQTSAVEATLRSDPSSVYSLMDFETCDTYRKVVEELAWGANRSEPEVASMAVAMAGAQPSHLRTGHVGYYLVDHGRARLEKELAYRAEPSELLRRALRQSPTLSYLGTILLGSLLLVTALVAWGEGRLPMPALLMLCGAALVPLSSIAVALTNWSVTKLVPPCTLPKLDFSERIPTGCKTAVVIPALVDDAADVDELLVQLDSSWALF